MSSNLPVTLFRALATHDRLVVVQVLILSDVPLDMGTVAERSGLEEKVASNALLYLYHCGIASRQKNGRHVFYQIESQPLAEMMEFLDNGVIK